MAEARRASASGTGCGVQGDDDMFSSLLNQNKMSPKGKSFTLTAQRRYRNGSNHNASLFLGIRNDYNKESVRKRTFGIVWPFWAKAEPRELVCAGLYYTGDGDVTQCFSCGAKIGDWEADDNAIDKHREANPSCPFVNGEDTSNVRDADDEPKAANHSPDGPVAIEEDNAAGLHFSENGRRVVSPLEEHRKKSANCSFLKTQKNESSKPTDWKKIPAVIVARGMGFEESLVHRAVRRLRRNKDQERASVLLDEIFKILDEEGSASESEDEEEEEEEELMLLKLKEKNAKMRLQVTCKRCYKSRVDVLLLPCCDVSVCEACVAYLRFCPISTCHKEITGTVKTILVPKLP